MFLLGLIFAGKQGGRCLANRRRHLFDIPAFVRVDRTLLIEHRNLPFRNVYGDKAILDKTSPGANLIRSRIRRGIAGEGFGNPCVNILWLWTLFFLCQHRQQSRRFCGGAVAVDAIDHDGVPRLAVDISITVTVLRKMTVDALHAFFEMDVLQMHRGCLWRGFELRRTEAFFRLRQIVFVRKICLVWFE